MFFYSETLSYHSEETGSQEVTKSRKSRNPDPGFQTLQYLELSIDLQSAVSTRQRHYRFLNCILTV